MNTKPLIYGVKRSAELMEQIELVEDYPSKIAAMLVEGTIDVGLVPVAIIPKLKEWHIVSDYCIGAEGAVASVCLFSEVPIERIDRVLLDYQSRTSVNLAKILLDKFWKLHPAFEEATENYQDRISGTTAGVVIGDRALKQRRISPYVYDLAEAWIQFTDLPFVFAAWISNRKLPPQFVELFNQANGVGIREIDQVVKENPCSVFDLHSYYTRHISYDLTPEKKAGLELFLRYLEQKS